MCKAASLRSLLTLSALLCSLAIHSSASTYRVIYSFHGTDGDLPLAEMIADSSGNLYGTTEFGGGTGKFGTVFKLTQGSGGTWTNTVLYAFTNGTDGGQPVGSLVFDASGNLYGTTTAGGDPACTSLGGFCGVVFKLTPGSGGTWTESVIHSFTGPDGLFPTAGLIMDSAGNLYGTTGQGGTFGNGTVFELSPASGGAWTETVLHSFNARTEGRGPDSLLVFDSAGNLYGTTNEGGGSGCASVGCGTVFELLPQSGGTWISHVLHRFDGTHGAVPVGVTIDSANNLFGAATEGGPGNCPNALAIGCGLAFELTPTSTGFSDRIIHSYNLGTQNPSKLFLGSGGVLYGTTLFGGHKTCDQNLEGCGTIYELTPAGTGYTFSALHLFLGGTDGQWPTATLNSDNAGNLFGTTQSGGDLSCGATGGCGTVFQIIP